VVAGVAEDWSTSPDGLRYEFRLRGNARWSNGDPVTAEDFVAGLRRAVDPATGAPGAALLGLIRNAPAVISGRLAPNELAVSAQGPRTLLIELSRPAPYFTAILANAVAYPMHRGTHAMGPDGNPTNTPLVSDGPYRLVEWTPGLKLRLARNANYWGAREVGVGTIEYLPMADSNAELARYRADALDVTSSVPTQQLDGLRSSVPSELQIRPQLSVVYYAFNLARPPFNASAGLREALSLAADREVLTGSVLRAGQVPAYSFVPPGISGYAGPAYAWRSEPKEQRLARARTLYAAAGYTTVHPLRVRLLIPTDDTLRRVALAVAAMWHESLGVETALIDREYRAFLATRDDRTQWDVVSHGWNADYQDPGNFLDIFTAGGVQNDAGLADPEFDRLMTGAAASPDASRRTEQLGQAERRLLDVYAVAPLYFPVSRRLVKPRVRGAILGPMNHNYSKYLRVAAP
jgi:oligopeptide transport system substrate-binding protein